MIKGMMQMAVMAAFVCAVSCGGGGLNGIQVAAFWAITPDNILRYYYGPTPHVLVKTSTVSGVQPGELIVAIDFSPHDHKLYGIGDTSRLYRLDPDSGEATLIGSGPFSPGLTGENVGMDFNAATNEIRVMTDAGRNFRINPKTGAFIAEDIPIVHDDPNDPILFGRPAKHFACAYTVNDHGQHGVTLYSICTGAGALAQHGPELDSHAGNTHGPHGIGEFGVNTTDYVGFDIDYPRGDAYVSFTVPGETESRFCKIDLATGTVEFIGFIGENVLIRDFALRFYD